MNARYEPTRRSTRFAAALAAVLTVVVLFDAVAGLADSRMGPAYEAAATVPQMAHAAAAERSVAR